jgi:hypothetical protein
LDLDLLEETPVTAHGVTDASDDSVLES